MYALYIARWLASHGIAMSEVDVVRASLLHDIGMTEDEVFLSPSRVKAYSHPRVGMRIALEEFRVNEVQADAILRHMWPIGHVPSHSREGWVIMLADKCCSMSEARAIAQSMVGRIFQSQDQTSEPS